MSKKNKAYEDFLVEHLPKVPDFQKTNLPKFDPGYSLGPPVKPTGEKDFIEFYFNNDVRQLQADIHMRPDHYTKEQKELVEAMAAKQPLPPGVTRHDKNELVMRLMEATDHRAQREKIVQSAQKATGPKEKDADPTVDRILEAQKLREAFENQEALPKSIKII